MNKVQRVINRLESSDPDFDDCLDAVAVIKELQEQVLLMREALELVESRFGPCQDELIFSKRLAIVKVRATLQALKQSEGETK